MKALSDQFTLKRSLLDGQLSLSIPLRKGEITLLHDDSASVMPAYEEVLCNTANSNKVAIFNNAEIAKPSDRFLVGLNVPLPDIKITEFLERQGIAADKAFALIEEYELKKELFLQCSQLSQSAGLKLLLIAALHNNAPLLVLNDPFQPFNGRWRETFAEKVLNEIRQHPRTVVVVNLSFVPKTWTTVPEFKSINVELEAEKLINSYVPPAAASSPPKLEKQHLQPERNENYYKPAIPIAVPEGLVSAYKEVVDRVFEPLAGLSNVLRNYSGPVLVLGAALFVALMAFILFSDLGINTDRMRTVAMNSSFNLSEPSAVKVVSSGFKSESKPNQVDSEKSDIKAVSEESDPQLLEQNTATDASEGIDLQYAAVALEEELAPATTLYRGSYDIYAEEFSELRVPPCFSFLTVSRRKCVF